MEKRKVESKGELTNSLSSATDDGEDDDDWSQRWGLAWFEVSERAGWEVMSCTELGRFVTGETEKSVEGRFF